MYRIISQLRLGTGIFLALFLVQHLTNHAFGIASIEAAETYRKSIGAVFQSTPAVLLLYFSLLLHASIALLSIYRRSSLRMSLWQWLQLLLGLSILPLLLGHIIGNRGFDLLGNVDPNYYYVVTTLVLKPEILVKLVALILVVWVHMAIGLHFWLRLKPKYPSVVAYLYALVLLLPALAYAGLANMLQQASTWADNPQRLDQIYSGVNEMSRSEVRFLRGLESQLLIALGLILLAVLIARHLRLWYRARQGSFAITHPDDKNTTALIGHSLLEALRIARIPHASVCGGRARCTTCRVRISTGLESLAPPNELEAAALAKIKAPANVRLACQIYPTANLAINPLVLANQSLNESLHRGGVQGHEEYVVAMFVDMRGSTSLGERVLAYDVVFILNRFFTELSSALQESHGHYAQFAGDGLMALYGLDPERKDHACRDALQGAGEMFRRIELLNRQLQIEFGESVEMGIGIHGGEAIVGTMGPPKTPLLTAVGDNINIAARLESQTKLQGSEIIVSIETLQKESIEFAGAEIKSLEVRGRDNQVRVCLLDRSHLNPGIPI